MKKINWGIIGCGDVTEIKSGPAFNKVSNSALVAVMRRDADKAKDYAQRHQVPRWYNDATQLINDPEVNAIYIATPPSTHETYTLAAIHAGKPVYVEKPMALNYAAAQNMAAAAAASNVKLVVAHYRRAQPLFKKIKELIDNKAELADEKIAWRVNPSIAGGGLFHDLSPHQLDLMYYFFGPVEKATGIAYNQGTQYAADDIIAGNILFKNGIAFSGVWCFNAPAAIDHCEIIGAAGTISFSFFRGQSIVINTNGNTNTLNFDPLPHVQQPIIEATVKYFLGEAPNPCSGEEAVEVMRLMQAFTNK